MMTLRLLLRRLRPIRTLLPVVLAFGVAACEDQNASIEALQKANAYRQSGELMAAVIELRSALQNDPDSAEAHFLMGAIHAEDVGDGDSAQNALLRARELGVDEKKLKAPFALTWILKRDFVKALTEIGDPESLPAGQMAYFHVLRGRAYMGLKDFSKADTAFKDALQVQPDYVPALAGLGQSALRNNKNYERVNEFLNKALAVNPNSREALHLQGDMLYLRKNYAEAETALLKAVELYEHNAPLRMSLVRALLAQNKLSAAVANLDEAFLPNPNDAGRVLLRAQAAFQEKNFDLAKHYSEEVLGLDPDNQVAMLLAAGAHYATGGYEATRGHMARFLKSNPGHILSRKLYGAALIKLGRSPEAYEVLRPLADKIPDDAGLLSLLGSAALAGGDLQEARRFIGQAVEKRPEGTADRARLGITKIALGNAEDGLEDLENVLEGRTTPQAQGIKSYLSAYRSGEFIDAISAARELKMLMPQHPLPPTLIGIARQALNDLNGSREALNEAITLDNNFVPAVMAFGNLERKLGRLERALQHFEKAQKLRPDRLQTLLRMAMVQLSMGRFQDAVGNLEKAVFKYPTALQPRIVFGQVMFRINRPEKALSIASDVLDHYPGNPGLLEVVGRSQLALRKPADAVATFRKLVDVLPDTPDSHFYLATAYRDLGDMARYESEIARALEVDPAHFKSLVERARLNLSEAKIDVARAQVDELIKTYPDVPAVAELDGTVALAEGRPEQAIAAFEKALTFGANSRLVIQLSRAKWLSKDQDGALATMKDWLQRQPGDGNVRLEYANLLLTKDRYQEAHGHLEAVVESFPNNALARNNLAWTLHRLDRNSAALLHAEKALELAPNNAGVMDTLGVILYARGKETEAISLLQRAVKLAPAAPDPKYHLARALAKVGKKDEARKVLKRLFANKNISFSEEKDAKQLLKKLGG